MTGERQSDVITQTRNGQVLSYVCEWMSDSEDEGLRTHRISVKTSERSLDVFMLVVMACFCASLAFFPSYNFGSSLIITMLGISLSMWAKRNRVEQEAVVVMPTLGIQLETVYCSKKVDRRFVALDKIVTPVISEAVTPVTSYFYLALILREENDLLLTFLHLRPSLNMILPVWRSIHEALGTKISSAESFIQKTS
ncbi:hypothetical protein R1flu_010233 [Riccia fluitans]|uniref:Phosphatidylinositol N-acetylglucosaminyltransferase subunit H conserved domain-containing protein n=1 Tax=Riccia fluitans TaxID=41844 RepID=A0ABD1Z4Q7_9MARC